MFEPIDNDVWLWSEAAGSTSPTADALKRAFTNCFNGPDGTMILEHLANQFVDRRVAPTASDALLRHVEGQRDAIAYVLRMARSPGHSISATTMDQNL